MATAAAATGTPAAADNFPPMQRIVCPERDDWRQTAEACGFDFHTIDGERYWDERGYYAFTLDEIERRIEAPTGEIDEMCLELVASAIDDEEDLKRLKIPRSVLAADLGELGARRRQPLRPARPVLRRAGTGEAARIQRRHADLDLRGRGVSMGLARTVDRTAHHPEGRRPVQFDPRAPDRGLEEGRPRPPPASDRHHRQQRGSGTLAYLEDTATPGGTCRRR